MKFYSGKMILILSLISIFLLLSLGLWWLYLITYLGNSVGSDITAMVKWEGGTFIVLISLLWAIFIYQYFKDRKRSQMIRDFFATMTHDLKTPLSKIQLQGDIISEEAGRVSDGNGNRLASLSACLIEDIKKLENQLDKVIQLARVERGEKLSCESVDLCRFIENCRGKWMGKALELNVHPFSGTSPFVWADEFALEIIFRNLFENTLLHGKNRRVQLELVKNGRTMTLTYNDGNFFSGELDKLGKLFYKHTSQGSGIGLYLIKKLMEQMHGRLKIGNDPNISFLLTFALAKDNTPK